MMMPAAQPSNDMSVLTDIISTTISAVSDGIDSEEEALMWACFSQVYLQEVRLGQGQQGSAS